MTAALSFDAMVRNMVALNIPREKAELAARAALALPAKGTLENEPPPRFVINLPWKLLVPWSMLCSDNEKYGVLNGRMMLKPDYRTAKAAIKRKAQDSLNDQTVPVASPVRIDVAVWVPDRRIHDVVNFAKCTHDALEGVVYDKDRWIEDAHWWKAGVDVDAPRAEVTVSHLIATTP